MPAQWVPDDVWLQLEPSAARMSGKQRLKAAGWIAAASVVALAIVYVLASGVVSPRLSLDTMSSSGSYGSCSETVAIANNGWFDETVLGATLRGNGTNAKLNRPFARTIPSGGSRTAFLLFRGRYCRDAFEQNGPGAAVPYPSLVLTLKRPWGTTTDAIPLDPGFYRHTVFFIDW